MMKRLNKNLSIEMAFLYHLQHFDRVSTDELYDKGCIGPDGERYRGKNWSELIRRLRKRGFIIQMEKLRENIYIYHGNFYDLNESERLLYEDSPWVFPKSRKKRTNK